MMEDEKDRVWGACALDAVPEFYSLKAASQTAPCRLGKLLVARTAANLLCDSAVDIF